MAKKKNKKEELKRAIEKVCEECSQINTPDEKFCEGSCPVETVMRHMKRTPFERYVYERCTNCAFLIEGDDGEAWICDETREECMKITECEEYSKDSPYRTFEEYCKTHL